MAEIKITFDKNGRAEFEVVDASMENLLTALMGVEAWCAKEFKLPIDELRLHMDEQKLSREVKS